MSAKGLLEKSKFFGDVHYYEMTPLEEGLFGQVDLKHGQLFKVIDSHYFVRAEGENSWIPWLENQFGILASEGMDEHPFKMGYFPKLNSIGEWVEPGMRIQTFDAFYDVVEPLHISDFIKLIKKKVIERTPDEALVLLLGKDEFKPFKEVRIHAEHPLHYKHWRPLLFIPKN